MLLFGFAGLPGYIPSLIWKNDLTKNIGLLSGYIAAFTITIWYAVNKIKHTGDVLSIKILFKKRVRVWQLIVLTILSISIAVFIDYLIQILKLEDWLKADIDTMMKTPLLAFFAMAILPSLLEEVLFRGIILHQFLKRYSVAASIMVSAVLFGAAHANPPQIIAGFVSGCFMGWVYFKTNNIWYCILIHFVNNSLAWFEYQVITLTPDSGIAKFTESLASNTQAFITALVVLLAGIYFLNNQYKKNKPSKAAALTD
jgi:membrane protease YdiL (CAAX protease family)